ncbi:hypothetical protein CSV79_15750 [Sporosarcina sp. P13]|uniref:hypothetical protein n=1 Tax=Sporosarcina sp. P13 TaxID=2048263 RepID=UPI000C17359A|nr:hypothetical protein [Sporosarcina sp. P13]PIC62700.1 hypothetical protein CSV79_15750 [Sporosarcina sp. P13]
METKFNNTDILGYGDFNEGQIYFVQRWLELLNIHTHSKYSVRYLNSHQALSETLYVCKGMMNDEIKRTDQHLRIVFGEANKIVVEDKLFSKYAENQAKIMKNTFQSVPKTTENAKIHSVIYRLEYVIRHLETNYLKWIVQEVNDLLRLNAYEDKDFSEIDTVLKVLASELLGKGWSLNALYSLIKETILSEQSTVIERFKKFFERTLSEPTTYIHLFSIKSNLNSETKLQLEQFGADLLNGNAVISTYSEYELEQNLSKNKEYIRIENNAHDIQSGINKAWQEVAEYLDLLRFYGYPLPGIATEPIVLLQNGKSFVRNIRVDLVEKKKKFRASKSMMEKVRNQLEHNNIEVNRKFKSLFEFTRISDESLSPQSAFLNLWIAIESFVRTEEYDGGIDNVRNVLSTSSTHNYLYGLLKNFILDCNRCDLEVEIDGQMKKVGKLVPQDAMLILLDSGNEQVIESACRELNLLLAYRYKELKSILKDGKSSSALLKNHKENIEQHVQRLYRIRNSIVHSAEIHYNTNLFIKHLHEYLESIMSVVVYLLEEYPDAKLEEIFAQVRDSVETTIETLRNSTHLDQETYYELVLKGAF